MYYAKMKDGRSVLIMSVDRDFFGAKGVDSVYCSASIEGGSFQIIRKDSLGKKE